MKISRWFSVIGLLLLIGGTGDRLVGAVGVSGLPSGVDEKAAQAGIAAWQKFREGQSK